MFASLRPRTHYPFRATLQQIYGFNSRANVVQYSTAQPQDDVALAQTAVKVASKLCMKVQRQLQSTETITKNDASPVTVADLGAQALVQYILNGGKTSNGVTMVAEETADMLRTSEGAKTCDLVTELVNWTLKNYFDGQNLTRDDVMDLIDMGGSKGGSEGSHWVLDPIDGTRGFVGGRQYAVCLGRVTNGEADLGVLGCPNLPHEHGVLQAQKGLVDIDSPGIGCLFYATTGGGCFSLPLDNVDNQQAQQLHVDTSVTGPPFESLLFMESYESAHSDHEFTAKLTQQLGITEPPIRIDSQAKYGLLARGEAGLFLRFPKDGYIENIWDHCAGSVIVQEAGGVVCDGTGAKLDYSEGRQFLSLKNGITAAAPHTMPYVIDAVTKNK